MARKNQRLINYHTSGKTTMPNGSDVHYGEIVVRHNEEAPELLIKVGEESFGVFQASGAVKTAIDSAVSTAKSELNREISTLEQSLSGHVADFEKFQEDVENTYATKTELGTAENNITTAYTKMVGDAKAEVYTSATTFATNAVTAAKGELNGAIADVASDLEVLSGVVKSVTTNIGDNYVSNDALESALEQVGSDIDSAKASVFASGKTYTDEQIDAAKKYADDQIAVSENTTNGLIAGVEAEVEALGKTVEANKKDVVDNYVSNTKLNTTVSTLEGKISDAQKAATDASSAYTDTQIAAAKKYTDDEIVDAEARVKQVTDNLDSKVNTLSGNVHTTITNVQTALTKTINDKVAVAYRYAGSCTYAELTGKTAEFVGEVWNVTDANGDFPAGTNYAWDGNKWDALGGSIDLSPYAKTEDVNKKIETINQTNADLQSAIGNVSAATETLVGKVSAATVATYATKTALQTAQDNITTAYTKAIGDAKAEAIGTASGYTDAQVLAAKNALGQTIQAVDGRVTDLSGVTKTVKATADSAVQTASVDCGVSVKKEGTELKFSFAELIIDCGDF
jgi:hypothetical protein